MVTNETLKYKIIYFVKLHYAFFKIYKNPELLILDNLIKLNDKYMSFNIWL